MTEFHDREDIRAELHDVNDVATLSRYARALGARLRIVFDYGNDLRQIA